MLIGICSANTASASFPSKLINATIAVGIFSSDSTIFICLLDKTSFSAVDSK
jgi:hypothetical protein